MHTSVSVPALSSPRPVRQHLCRLLIVQLRLVAAVKEHLVTIAVAAVNEEGEWLVATRWRKYHCG